MRRELIQSLHIWRSRLDMHMAIARRDPDLNYQNHYPETAYEPLPDTKQQQRTQQRNAAYEAAKRKGKKNYRPKEDS